MKKNNKKIICKGSPKYPLRNLYINPTRFCNLKCKHCWIAPPYSLEKSKKYDLDLDFFKDVIKQAKKLGLQAIKLTGSEPLIYKEVYELLKFNKAQKIPTIIETNGITADRFNAKLIAKAGVKFMSVSLDGSSPEDHDEIRGVRGSFDKAVDGARNLIREGIDVQIIFSILRSNLSQLKEMPYLAKSIGAGSLKVNIVVPFARANKVKAKGGLLSLEENIEIFKKFEERFYRNEPSPLPIYYDIPPAFFEASTYLRAPKLSSCNIRRILGLLPDGKVSLCGIGFVKKSLIFGDLHKQSLAEIWENSPTLNKIREDVPDNIKGICSKCMFYKFCLGKCVAHNIYHTGRSDVSYHFCEQAYGLGLFPKSRLVPKRKTSEKKKASASVIA